MPAEAMKVAFLLAPVQRVFANRNGIDQSLRRFNDQPQFTLREPGWEQNRALRQAHGVAPMLRPALQGTRSQDWWRVSILRDSWSCSALAPWTSAERRATRLDRLFCAVRV